jgi:hypothetical protein
VRPVALSKWSPPKVLTADGRFADDQRSRGCIWSTDDARISVFAHRVRGELTITAMLASAGREVGSTHLHAYVWAPEFRSSGRSGVPPESKLDCYAGPGVGQARRDPAEQGGQLERGGIQQTSPLVARPRSLVRAAGGRTASHDSHGEDRAATIPVDDDGLLLAACGADDRFVTNPIACQAFKRASPASPNHSRVGRGHEGRSDRSKRAALTAYTSALFGPLAAPPGMGFDPGSREATRLRRRGRSCPDLHELLVDVKHRAADSAVIVLGNDRISVHRLEDSIVRRST